MRKTIPQWICSVQIGWLGSGPTPPSQCPAVVPSYGNETQRKQANSNKFPDTKKRRAFAWDTPG